MRISIDYVGKKGMVSPVSYALRKDSDDLINVFKAHLQLPVSLSSVHSLRNFFLNL